MGIKMKNSNSSRRELGPPEGGIFHISHDASLQTILSTEARHVTWSFHHGRARGDVLASSAVPRLEPSLPLLHRFELRV